MDDDLPLGASAASGEAYITPSTATEQAGTVLTNITTPHLTATAITALTPISTSTLMPRVEGALSDTSSFYTRARAFTRYLFGELSQVPATLAPHTNTILYVLGTIGASGVIKGLFRNEKKRSRANVQLAISHILCILEVDKGYGDDVTDEDRWSEIRDRIAAEARRVVEAHHLTRSEGLSV
ncbi:hypothetical protein BU23DRAFT_215579 [Bimuria novae-zelandiae CBS 107.79]|uniref:Uncharacterized protein n=1 Tax=Bimuria novae-zelandiae CBS 107.79 TaxID=1447943 RepID=A0A6A5UYQ4_9PLEO|nr:hypothetical protein BU23DRAFT_215579 [Bimuria novae-zelandiae CBS 107.79]